jgi:hypothetical protein
MVYNFTINNGVDAQGRVILIDFNDVTFSLAEVRQRTINQEWSNAWSLGEVTEDVYQYYLEQVAERVTMEALKVNWGSRCE